MDVKNINQTTLKGLKIPLEIALISYEKRSGIKFCDFPDLAMTPEKSNSARTVIPVEYKGAKVGDLYTIVFRKGDGTGDSKTFRLDELTIPEHYKHAEMPERVLPRAKTGIFYEAVFPLFSVSPQGYIAMFAAALDELGVVNNILTPLWRLGMPNQEFEKALSAEILPDPSISFTVTEAGNGKRLGDPHSIYYDRNTADALQVVGFFSSKDKKMIL